MQWVGADNRMIPVRGQRFKINGIALNYNIIDLIAFECIQKSREFDIFLVVEVAVEEIASSYKGDGGEYFILILFNFNDDLFKHINIRI